MIDEGDATSAEKMRQMVDPGPIPVGQEAFTDQVHGLVVDVASASRQHRTRSTRVVALDEVSLTVSAGEGIAVVGASGAGKTTLLNLISGLDRPTSGRVTVMGLDLGALKERQLTRFRAARVGVVFQDSYLLPGLSALENVTVSGMGLRSNRELRAEAAALLEAVGLADRMSFPPSRLSGGERQRVGVARAIMGGRPLLVADEPTGNLDMQATSELLDLFDHLRATRHITIVVATHDPVVAERMSRRVTLAHGRLQP